MGLPAAARAFNDISEVYDETRSPMSPDAVVKVADTLHAAGVDRLLEVGVGTGRIARPLTDAGFTVVGIDAARRMMARARAKGLSALVQGSAYHLPFATGRFDATLFVHVLHVLDDTPTALREAGRVSRQGIYALVVPRKPRPERPPGQNPMALLKEELAAGGWTRTETARPPGAREAELLEQLPPDETVVVRDQEVVEPVGARLEMVARRASRHYRDVPPEVLDPAIARVRARIGDGQVTFRLVELLVRWEPRRFWEGDAPAP